MDKCRVEYPKNIIRQARERSPKPTFVEGDYYPKAVGCMNCNGRGFLVAFFADYQHSAVVGGVPPVTEKGKVLKWVRESWWVGEHISFPCPVCRTEVK